MQAIQFHQHFNIECNIWQTNCKRFEELCEANRYNFQRRSYGVYIQYMVHCRGIKRAYTLHLLLTNENLLMK